VEVPFPKDMSSKKHLAEKPEILPQEASIKVIRADADSSKEDPQLSPVFEQMFPDLQEFKKIRFFGILAFPLSITALKFSPFICGGIAIAFALLDLFWGSTYTRKISRVAIIIAVLAMLNAWQ
jgi:hypothetical protein